SSDVKFYFNTKSINTAVSHPIAPDAILCDQTRYEQITVQTFKGGFLQWACVHIYLNIER
ncbi:hypothetical protein ANANG_G00295700, partial [Anguilla anguilla]